MDAGMWIILGTFLALPVAFALAWLISNIKEELNNKKISERFGEKEGTQEIEKLKSFMKNSNIPIPTKMDDSGVYIKSLLRLTHNHYENMLKKSLEENGYSKNFELSKIGTVYYNSQYALIFKNIFIYITPNVKSGFTYSYTDVNGKKQYLSLQQFIDFCKSLGEPNAYKTLSKQIAHEDLHWYVEYPASAGYNLADTAAGAVIGGLALGPIGALLGATSSSKSQKKKEEEEVEVFWVEKSVHYSIDHGTDCKYTIDKLNKHLPKNRLSDSYKKNI